jgi:hypothetical protein
MASHYFAVRRRHGPGWDDARGLREQALWTEHADLMDAMVAEGFIVLGGPIGDGSEVLLVFDAPREDVIHSRLEEDPWTRDSLLVTTRVEPWTVLLDRTAP